MAGLPGTGLGGIFYALLVLLVVGREAVFTYLRRSSDARRAMAARMLALVVLMAGVFWLEGYIVMLGIGWFNDALASTGVPVPVLPEQPASEPVIVPISEPVSEPMFDPVPEAIIPALAWTPFIFLGIVLIAVQIARRLVARQARSSGSRM
jgi:hypothetical protein